MRGRRDMAVEGRSAVETQADERQLSGDKVQRIVDAMRTCIAQRGITGATFEHVSREAGVSRGLLHYYFGTKERLLIEVLRSDAEVRIGALDQPLEAAKTADDVLDVFVAGAEEILQSDPGFYVLIFELFTAGRQNPEIRAELAQVYEWSRPRGGRSAASATACAASPGAAACAGASPAAGRFHGPTCRSSRPTWSRA